MKPGLEDLTLREKIGQTCIMSEYKYKYTDDYKKYFTENPIGSTWSCGETREDYIKLATDMGKSVEEGYIDDLHKDFVNMVNSLIKVPAIPVMDANNGIPAKKMPGHAGLPFATGLGATGDPELAFEYGKLLGEDLRLAGIRWLWSPVADNSEHFKDLRELSADHENNAKLLAALVKGIQSAGVATAAKHFPGSDPIEYRDTHFCTASYAQSFEYWEKTQALEFKACIDAGVDSIMVGHDTFDAVDDTMVEGRLIPCTLSKKVITDLLKGKMGFKGVVLTDDVAMKAFSAIYGSRKSYVVALNAGIDMILSPTDLDYIDIIEEAVKNGEIAESRIDDACQRVLDMKDKYGIFDSQPYTYPTEEEREAVRAKIHALSEKIAAKGMTLVTNTQQLVPINRDSVKRVKLVYIGYSDVCYENLRFAVEEFARYGAECDLQRGFSAEDNKTLKDYDIIIYATFIGLFEPEGGPYFFGKECWMLQKIMTVEIDKSIGVSFGNPDIYFNYFTAAKTFVNCYSYNEETIRGFVKGLYGDISFTDYAPFPLNPITRTNNVYLWRKN